MHRAILQRFGIGLTLIAAAGSCSSDDGGTGPTPTISISANPTTASVVQGGSTQITATLTRGGGFTGTVTFAVDSTAGVTGMVGNVQTTGSTTTATITIQVGLTVSPGSHSITVRATGSGVSPATATFQLTVTAAPSITLSLTPAGAISLQQGSTDNSKTLIIARVNFTGAVALTAEGLPNGVSASFAGDQVAGVLSSVMTLTATPGATVGGPVPVRIRGTGLSTPANLDATTTFQLTITATPSFTLAITPPPATVSVPVGTQNSSKTVTITRVNYTAAITLSHDPLPNGVTATFAENTVTGNSSVLTLAVAPTAEARPEPIVVTIRGTGAAFSGRDEALPVGVAIATLALTVQPPLLTQVAPGERHTCALATNDAIYCWGRNAYGQLGDGHIGQHSATPVKVIGGHSFKAVHTGGNHTCGITQQDRGFCWGAGLEGQLGLGPSGTGVDIDQPREIAGGQYRWQTMGHMGDSSCGITTLPGLFTLCWGLNADGELGDGTTINAPSPVLVSGGHTFSSLGRYGGNNLFHKCAITIGFALFCWGENDFGQIGNGTMGSGVLQPVRVGGTADTYFLTAQADDATCAIRTTGIAQCWGNNSTGRIGDNSTISQSVPTTVSTTETFTVIGLGLEHTCALNLQRRAFCWGSNQFGQLGDGTNAPNRLVPVPVTGGHLFTDIRVGLGQTCGLRTDGQVLCWGWNQDGQLGDGTTTHSNVPKLIFAPLPP